MSVLSSLFTTFLPPLVILLVVFSPPLFHVIVSAIQSIGKLSSAARVPALVRRRPALQPAI